MPSNPTLPTLTFLGAAGTVTGSKYLLKTKSHEYLIDCGLFQGPSELKQLNWEPFPMEEHSVDGVILTHAHIDHIGYLPRLVKQGYKGPVYATPATKALMEISLPDSASIQEQDAAYANKKGYSKHKPALPLYTVEDAERTLKLIQAVPFRTPLKLPELTVSWHAAGHIIGSGILIVELATARGTRRVVFSGDLGRYNDMVMKPPTEIEAADVLLVESTYGNRLHEDDPIEKSLKEAVRYILDRRGVLLIPAFAIGRTQQILYHLRLMQEAGEVPPMPVYVDSPMARNATAIYCEYTDDHNFNEEMPTDEAGCPLLTPDTRFVRDVSESQRLNKQPGPMIVISASGMLTGGRILHHLKWRLPDPNNVVLFVGFQAEGTRGRLLLEGRPEIKIHGEEIPVRARIMESSSLSAHGDYSEIMRWLRAFKRAPERTYVVHGEEQASQSMRDRIEQELGWNAIVPERNQTVALG
jgi:metallo-beta-lactamase family protein